MCCLGELRSLRALSLTQVIAHLSYLQSTELNKHFSGYVEMKVSQTYNKSESWLRPWNFITEDRRTFEVVRSVK